MSKKQTELAPLYTRWGQELERTSPLPDYPRPQMVRDNWLNLNGLWQYAIVDSKADHPPQEMDGEIVVPFSPESLLSSVGTQLLPHQTLWYSRTVTLAIPRNKRALLHFGAVDQNCTVYCNGKKAGNHEGGYWPFCFDVTELLQSGDNLFTVSVTDASNVSNEAYGKQSLKRGGIWYTAQSGIWQTVWLEYVPECYIESYHVTPKYDTSEVAFSVKLCGLCEDTTIHLQIYDGDTLITDGRFRQNEFTVSLPRFKSWTPEQPFLYDFVLRVHQDAVRGYFGMRKVSMDLDDTGNPRFCLNNKPYYNTGLLDQGYWSDGLYTAPADEAMIYDIIQMKRLGFNMLRKHIKIEPLRWYYHCDRLGMLVWQDFVSGGTEYDPFIIQVLPFINIALKDNRYRVFGRECPQSRAIFERDMYRTMDLLYNSPSIVVWVPFNEGWGQFDAARICDEVRKKDVTRLVDHASGWHDQKSGDFCSKHIYYKPYKIRRDRKNRIQALTEFGGYSKPTDGHMTSPQLFGYKMFETRKSLTDAIETLYRKEVLPSVDKGLSVSIYTQVSDVEDEINGILTYDRAECKVIEETIIALNEELKQHN